MTDRDFASLASELETTKLQLMLASDTTGLASILSDELYYVHSNGIEDNKKSYLEKVGNQTFIYLRLDSSPGQVTSLAENAFSVHAAVSMEATVGGVERRVNYLFLAIWRREHDSWRLVAQQSTLAPLQ
jgi:hypothetical protein